MLSNHSKEICAWRAFGYFFKGYDKLKFLQWDCMAWGETTSIRCFTGLASLLCLTFKACFWSTVALNPCQPHKSGCWWWFWTRRLWEVPLCMALGLSICVKKLEKLNWGRIFLGHCCSGSRKSFPVAACQLACVATSSHVLLGQVPSNAQDLQRSQVLSFCHPSRVH